MLHSFVLKLNKFYQPELYDTDYYTVLAAISGEKSCFSIEESKNAENTKSFIRERYQKLSA